MEEAAVCLVTISVARDYIKPLTKRQQKIVRRFTDCFPDIVFKLDSVEGCFNLNQEFGEVITPLATSFGLMDFVELPLADSIWIAKLYLTREIDIVVNYVENYDKKNMGYQLHTTFPNWENITMHPYPATRSIEYFSAYKKMLEKNNL